MVLPPSWRHRHSFRLHFPPTSLSSDQSRETQRPSFPQGIDILHIDLESGLALGRVSLGFINAAEQPAYNEDRSLLAVMEGELYDYEVQRRALAVKGHTFRTESHA
jgi:asparagine synthetase B (glutamine-hydrolysing)